MNEMTDTGQIALPATQADITALFSASDQVDALIERIEKEVRSHAPDLTTAKGRKAIASLAAKVSKSKTALDGAGKNLNAGYREKIDAVDAERRKIRDRLDALRDEARKPLTDWEKAEEDRKARMRVKVDAICIGPLSAMSPSQDIKVRIAELESVEVNETWAEFQDEAAFNKDTALTQLRMMLEASEKREADERELARLRAEAAEREAKERAEREAREKAEREERVRREAKEAEARRVAEEKTRQEQIARAASSARSGERDVSSTRWPAAARASAVARPMPLVAPVTRVSPRSIMRHAIQRPAVVKVARWGSSR